MSTSFKYVDRAVSNQKTFGYKRFEVLAAAINGITLILIAIVVCYEAMERFLKPPEVATMGMLIISISGLMVNVFVAWLMMRGADTKGNLNMRGAFMHVIGDILGSVGAIIAALLMMDFGFLWADPLASVIVAIIVFKSGLSITKGSVHILMEGAPEKIDVEKITKKILYNEQILAIHDLHLWTISSGLNMLTCHIVVDETMQVKESENIVKTVEHQLLHEGIHRTRRPSPSSRLMIELPFKWWFFIMGDKA